MSWNGATDVEGWEVWAGEAPEMLRVVGTAPKMGFETVFETQERCVQVRALGVLEGVSEVVCV